MRRRNPLKSLAALPLATMAGSPLAALIPPRGPQLKPSLNVYSFKD